MLHIIYFFNIAGVQCTQYIAHRSLEHILSYLSYRDILKYIVITPSYSFRLDGVPA